MEKWLWGCIGIMTIVIIVLIMKIHMLKKAADEISNAFADRLMTDTNILIDISSNDKHMRKLTNSINVQLRILRKERHRFQQGDMELKNAVTNISHDLRTPLTAICGYLDLLKQEEKSEAVERYIQIIQNRAEILTQLTEELFCYSIIMNTEGRLEKKAIVVNEVLEESIAAFYADLNECNIIPSIRMPEKKVVRNVDRSALSRVFSNLLNNVIKYSDGDLEIIMSETGEIIFMNTASGLNEVQVGKLFEGFFTVENARKSTGLGLTIARTLIEQMNGRISAKYENNKISITVFFPE